MKRPLARHYLALHFANAIDPDDITKTVGTVFQTVRCMMICAAKEWFCAESNAAEAQGRGVESPDLNQSALREG